MKFKKIYFFVIFFIFMNITKINCEGNTCLKCNNKETPECLDKPDPSKTCNDQNSTCVMYVSDDDQYLYRDCYSDVQSKIPNCNAPNCKTCTDGNNCNSEAYFPKDSRHKCYTCNDADCFKKTNLTDDLSHYCAKNVDKCFTHVKDGTTTERGCISNQKDNTCAQTKECITCDGKNCNNADSEIELNCYECNGNDQKCKRPDTSPQPEDCKIGDENIKGCSKYLLGHEEPKNVCYIKRSGNNVERGCYVMKKPFVEKNSTIEISGNKGNGKCLKDLECIQCSDKDKCKNDNDEKLKELAKGCNKFTTSCYRFNNNDGNTVRGCGTPSNENIRASSFCYDDKCIAKEIPKSCYYCHSENDENCALLKNLTKLPTKECDECAIKINENGHTVRGCKKDILGDKNCGNDDKLCYICSSKDDTPCNGIIFPKDRRQCYQCTNCNNITQQNSYSCRIYKADEKCYMYAGNNNEVVRGCISDTDANKNCENAKEKCFKCDTDQCNSDNEMKCPTLKCIKCDSKDNDDCKWGFNQEQSVSCRNQIGYWKTETCYTCNIDNRVTRGCEWDAGTALSDKCKKCIGDGCNGQSEIEFTCIRCRSDNPGQESCGIDGAGIEPLACNNPVTKADRGCFTDKDVKTGVIIRGCLVDFYIQDRLKCKDENYSYCQSCLESNCNNHTMSSGAKNQYLSNFVLLSFVALISLIQFVW